MDKLEILVIIIPPLAAVLGFLLKYFLERRTEHKLKLNKHTLDRVEFKLKIFYQPILTNLIRENSIFENLIKFHDLDTIPNEMKLQLDKDILDIHIETQKIIQLHLTDVNPSDELLDMLIQYDKHVLIFTLLRKYKNENDATKLEFPGGYGIPYPTNLQKFITKKIKELKLKQNRLIGDWKAYNASINSSEPIS